MLPHALYNEGRFDPAKTLNVGLTISSEATSDGISPVARDTFHLQHRAMSPENRGTQRADSLIPRGDGGAQKTGSLPSVPSLRADNDNLERVVGKGLGTVSRTKTIPGRKPSSLDAGKISLVTNTWDR